MTYTYDDYILWYLFASAIILVYLTTFIKPEIEKMEEQNKDNKDTKNSKNDKANKVKVDPYLPFYINSPLSSPILSYSNHSYLFKNNTV
jgi:hypothetical protein